MQFTRKQIFIGLAVVTLIIATSRAIWHKNGSQVGLEQSSSTTQMELNAQDVLRVRIEDLQRTLDISGTVKAVNFAVIKARVPGEIKEILVHEGDHVKAGQILARMDSLEYQHRFDQAKEQADAAKSQMEIAQRQWDSNRALVEQGFISKTALDNSQASYQGAVSSYKAALAGAEVAKKSLDDAVLRAPFSGQVALRVAQIGERVGVDARILDLVDLSQLEVEVALSPSDSIDVRPGQKAQLQIEDRPEIITAEVKRISPSAQAGNRSVMVYLGLDQAQGLRHGLFAKGNLRIEQLKTLALPLTAVRTDRAQPYVQVLTQQGNHWQVNYQTVQIGARGVLSQNQTDETWVSLSGVNEGVQVLRGEIGALREGTLAHLNASVPFPTAPASSAASAP